MPRSVFLRLLSGICVLGVWLASKYDPQPVDEAPLPAGALQRIGSLHLRHGSGILASQLSPDGKILATMSDRSVILWDLSAEKRVKQFPLPARISRFSAEVVFSRDGQYLACWSESSSPEIWEVSSGKQTLSLDHKLDTLLASAAFTLDSKEFRVLAGDKVSFYDPATGSLLRALDRPSITAILPDGKSGLAYDKDASCLIITDIEADKERWRTPFKEPLFRNFFLRQTVASDGESIVLLKGSKVEIRDLLSGKLRAAMDKQHESTEEKPEDRQLTSLLRIACNGGRVFVWGAGQDIRQWETATGKELPTLRVRALQNIHLLPGGRKIVTTGLHGLLQRVDVESGAEVRRVKSSSYVSAAAVNKEGRVLATIDQRGQIDLWKKIDGQRMMSKSIAQSSRYSTIADTVAFSSDSKHLALNTFGSVLLLNLETGRDSSQDIPRELGRGDPAMPSRAAYVQFHPNGNFLLSSGPSKPVTIVAMPGGAVARPIDSLFATYSTNGKLLAAIAASNREFHLQILDSSSFKVLRSFHLSIPKTFQPTVMAFSNDDRQLVVGSGDEMIFFDVRSGNELCRIRFDTSKGFFGQQSHAIQSFAFSPKVDWMLSGGADGAVRLWEIATYKEMLCLEGHEGDVRTVAFGPNGVTAISAANDGLAYLWDLRPKAPESKPTLDHLWQQLASDDARLSYQAIWAIRDQAKEASVFLRNKIPPAKLVEKAQLQRLIKDLDSSKFQEREAATRTLAQTGDQAAPALEEALAKSPPLEMRQRLQKLLDAMRQGAAPEELRVTRAVQALALAGTPEALETLRTWAKGAPEARLSRLAKSAVLRLDGTSTAK